MAWGHCWICGKNSVDYWVVDKDGKTYPICDGCRAAVGGLVERRGAYLEPIEPEESKV